MNIEEAMDIALEEAKLALDEGEVPVGAVVLKDGEIVGAGHNQREKEGEISGHAEIVAMEKAAKALGRWQLDDCVLVVTLEPCLMCGGAIGQARVKTLAYGADDLTYGVFSSNLDPFAKHIYPSPLIYRGVKKDKCEEILKAFFKSLRK